MLGTARTPTTHIALGRSATVLFALGAGAILVDACVVADPPTDLPQTPAQRPTIVHASVVPSTTSIIGTWPKTFIVPVELSNPLSPVQWASFVDYNPITGEGFDNSDTNKETSAGNIRMLKIPITEPSSDRCHVVEVVVALQLNTRDQRNAHTPEGVGGDSVSWFYNPTGDLSGCPVLDAGLSPRVDDAGVEAGGT